MYKHSVYLDNAATSFPKAPGVAEAVYSYLTKAGGNINRGSYIQAFEAEDTVLETRELICELFSTADPEYVVFTKNITESLNILIKGFLQPGDHILISSMEHNAVLRPLNHLKQKYNPPLEIGILPCNSSGELPTGAELIHLLEQHLQGNTKAIMVTHASNVCGTILPIKELGSFCRQHDLYFFVDAAQTAGVEDLNFTEINADALAFTGHKALLGPQGIGGLVLSPRLASRLEPLITGGTGSSSEGDLQPPHMPDKFEAGTLNLPGIFGLNASLKYIQKIGQETIQSMETLLITRFLEALPNLKGVNLVGLPSLGQRTAVFSLDFIGMDNAFISHTLASHFGISNRAGLHCAPLAHKTLHTFPQGTVRLSFSHFNTPDDVDLTLEALSQCVKT